MELKPYQQEVINDLVLFLEHVQIQKDTSSAFHDFWSEHPKSPLQPFPGTAIEPYKNNITGVPHICLKVPTAGGKTFIACNALKPVFDLFPVDKAKTVVWLVPSITILDQTILNLKDPNHPYRQKINSHFSNKVEVFDKAALLQGTGFNISTVKEQLNILVFSFDSLRAKNKEDRKVFQENGNLQSFESILEKGNDITLGAILKYLNPIVIVDESHNAESDLSIDMLKELNPCFILDLTATPRKNSNIISFIDAIELKKENMVKLPVIVYNHQDKDEVINSAIQLRNQLEIQAKDEEKKGGKYIRPIVLFQAQPKSAEDNTTFEMLRAKLIEKNIPAEQIRIKTANQNEIRNDDLMSRESQVRYIITVNALKEGWDCPFAYILASLADKNSAVDVEQILGRVLRQPYVMKHKFPLLNMSYVLTASSKFLDTLDNIVKGLNKAGFSDQDYKVVNEVTETPQIILKPTPTELLKFPEINTKPEGQTSENPAQLSGTAEPPNYSSIAEIEKTAYEQNEQFEAIISEFTKNPGAFIPTEIKKLVKNYNIKEVFQELSAQIILPQFFYKIPANDIFGNKENDILLEKEHLLEGFALSKVGTDIEFSEVNSELYKIDLDETKKGHTPTFVRIDGNVKESVINYILDPSRKEKRVSNMTRQLMNIIGNIYPISDREIEKYISLILENFSDEQFRDLANHEYTYSDKIKKEIRLHCAIHAQKVFSKYLDTDKVFMKPSYTFKKEILLNKTCKDLPKTLYEKEGFINPFEERVINEIANFENIAFWTRNETNGFRINGFINHFPDFIIQTKSGKTIILETKGDHLEAIQKIKLGNLWASKAGNDFRYFLVYDERNVEGAYKLDYFLNTLKII